MKFGGVMAAPKSLEENDFMVTLIPEKMNAWINCNDFKEEGEWECGWEGRRFSFRNWDDGQPNNIGNNGQQCAFLSRYWGSKNKWHDAACEEEELIVCKLRKPRTNLQ